MRKVTDFDVVSDFERTKIVQLPHDTAHQCRFTFSVFANESHFLSAADGQIDVFNNGVRAVILTQVLNDNREVPASRSGRKTQVKTGCVLYIHFQPFQFIELLDAGLYLYGFSSLVAETLNEIFRFLNHLLLIHVCAHLLLMSLLTQNHKLRVIDVVVVDATKRYLNRSVGNIVNKCAIVTNYNHSTLACLKE